MRPNSIRYVETVKRTSGAALYYARRYRGGPRIRLPDDPESQEFLMAYGAAMAKLSQMTSPVPRKTMNSHSIGWLIRTYMDSSQFNRLASSTQKYQRYALKRISTLYEHTRFSKLTSKQIKLDMEAFQTTPEAANAFLKTLKSLIKWAIHIEYVDVDPTIGVHYFPKNREGFHTWQADEMQAFEKAFPIGTPERLAYELLACTGARVGDVIRLGATNIHEGSLRYVTQKTQVCVRLPIVASLQQALDTGPVGQDTFLQLPKKCEPFSDSKAFSRFFRKACKAADVPGTPHGLRKAAAVRLAHGGATTNQICAALGWKTVQMAELYTKAMDRETIGLHVGHLLARDPMLQ